MFWYSLFFAVFLQLLQNELNQTILFSTLAKSRRRRHSLIQQRHLPLLTWLERYHSCHPRPLMRVGCEFAVKDWRERVVLIEYTDAEWRELSHALKILSEAMRHDGEKPAPRAQQRLAFQCSSRDCWWYILVRFTPVSIHVNEVLWMSNLSVIHICTCVIWHSIWNISRKLPGSAHDANVVRQSTPFEKAHLLPKVGTHKHPHSGLPAYLAFHGHHASSR